MHTSGKVSVSNGVVMDRLGYGLYKVPADDAHGLCTLALEAGYRLLDTAAMYGNEEGVGRAVRDAVDAGHVDRGDVFVTSKVWNEHHGYRATLAAFEDSLKRSGLDYLDLYLIHWPCPAKDQYVDTWRALEELYSRGRVRAIGVSNFQRHHLENLLSRTEVVPAVNQIELHPFLQQQDLRSFNAQHGIVTQAWSPLGRGTLLTHPTITHIAAKHSRSPAQVILRWHLQSGGAAVAKASSRERIVENLSLSDFALDTVDMAAIAQLNSDTRVGSHPDLVN
ncbi:aldo/keto reductase [Arthrobacter tumbae]|uniref:aldo/keto reductase n=1 Tax=Arthrobacter tumbae TaxID=163874 RepID=UPI00195C6B79|nr:aldo/keto reductase [Arthrobacter tumbae]MBM7783194.1 diketogulonate reductase-like aldo/keto reductase [Arthrobacter tumbae]